VIAVLSTAALASIALVLLILARLTEKWQAVTRRRSYYYVFYPLAAAMVLFGGVHLYHVAALVPGDLPLDPSEQQLGVAASPPQLRAGYDLVFYYLPLALTMTISVLLAWRNWGWILRRKYDQTPATRSRRLATRGRQPGHANPRQDAR
jgi:hypothetical protein